MEKFLPYALPDIGEEEIQEVLDSLRSGWLTTGPKTKQFEKDFAEFIGEGAQAIAVNSATAGLHLGLEALGVGPGDEVITTPYTFTSTAEVVRYLGADPVFVDIDPDTFNIDPALIEAAITEKTKVIVPVHFAGLSCDMDEIIRIARKYNLKVMEDAAHALPTTYKKKLIGTLDTDVTVYSFYATKTIATGEGGMIITRDEDVANRCRIMRLHGISRDAFDRYTSTKPAWHYEVVAPGFKYNMGDLNASLGIHQLRKAWAFQEKRDQMARCYDEGLADLPVILPPKAREGDYHSHHVYALRLTSEAPIGRDEFIGEMSKRGIGCSVHFIPLHIHPYYRDTYHFKPEDYPKAYKAYKQEVSLPLYTKMTEEDIQRVITQVRDILGAV